MIKAIIKIVAEEEIVAEEDVGNELEKRQGPKRIRNRKSCFDNLKKVQSGLSKKGNTKKSFTSNLKTKKKTINKDYFYDLLFTRKNLKLVHIVCHDKQIHHNKKCNENEMFIEQ